jgi:hypothetical protein
LFGTRRAKKDAAARFTAGKVLFGAGKVIFSTGKIS